MPAVLAIGEANLNSVTAIGSTTPDTLLGMPRTSVAVKQAGRAASEERVLNPMICAGASARAKSRSPIPAIWLASGYSARAKIVINAHTMTMNEPRTLIAETPSVAASGNTSAKMPMGASSMIQAINTNIVSLMAEKKPTKCARCSFSIFSNAIEKRPVKIMRGSTALSAAARMGLIGMSATSQSRKGGNSVLPTFSVAVLSSSLRLASGSMLNIAMSGGATRNTKRLEATIMDMNKAIVLPPSCATTLVLP